MAFPKFTDFVIKQISLQNKNIVFLLWGNFAIAKSSLIDGNKHLIIKKDKFYPNISRIN